VAALSALLRGVTISGSPNLIAHDLLHTKAFGFFVTVLLAVAVALVGVVAGVSVTRRTMVSVHAVHRAA
jgi:uncharacterized membrane protein